MKMTVVHPAAVRALGDQTLSIGVLSLRLANFDLRALFIGDDGGTHCPLIEGLPPIRTWGGGLGPL
jgi:hypothetical protein